jgi:nicotinate-nucleotide adenylyltransferase
MGKIAGAATRVSIPGRWWLATGKEAALKLALMAEPLVLLGGTFDPPHIGHLVLAQRARSQFGAARALFVPAGDPWRKTSQQGTGNGEQGADGPLDREPGDADGECSVSPAKDRLAMVRLAVAGIDTFVVDDREIRRPGPSYTVDTLEELRAEGHTALILVLGADALDDLPNWKSPERIRELATLAVAPRPPAKKKRGKLPPEAPLQNGEVRLEMAPMAISSTNIRERVSDGRPIRHLVPEAVEAYIFDHGLYRVD